MACLSIKPYGSWKSPITSDLIVAEAVKLSDLRVDGDDTYWIEMRPAEGGRNVIVKRAADGTVEDATPAGFNARTRAHEYGGGAYLVHRGQIFFANDADQHLYRQTRTGSQPQPLSAASNLRFADAVFDSANNRLIVVVEDHTDAGKEAQNYLATVSPDGDGKTETLISGNDFYSNPVLSPDGQRLAWLTWNHPNMPWDGTELWQADVGTDGKLGNQRRVAGGTDESIFQPQWSPDGQLYFVSDRSGWWNLYREQNGDIRCLLGKKAEFGLPQWVFGMSTYGFASAERLVCSFCENGSCHVGTLDTGTGELEEICLPFNNIDALRVGSSHAVLIAGSEVCAKSVILLDLASLDFEVVRRSANPKLDSTFFSRPEAIEFPTEGGLTAHGYFYRPQNRDFCGPEGALPPLIVKSHGGPTSAASATLELRHQFWTSRGFAVLDVDYGGSTGYGRKYRKRLEANWGIVDVDDCINAAKYVIAKGLADGNRVAIAGGSAGGYTTLSALTFRDFFKAGASYYGVCDLEAIATETHKFESRYLEKLVGPYPARKDIYEQRSPIHFTGKLACPAILMQGLEDKVVPPNQAEMMVEALRAKGLPVAYVAFEGEQHGFRKAESIKRALEAELYFYSQIFGFEPADELEPLNIENI